MDATRDAIIENIYQIDLVEIVEVPIFVETPVHGPARDVQAIRRLILTNAALVFLCRLKTARTSLK